MVLGPEALRIGGEIGRKLLIIRLRYVHVLGEKFHLLPHAASNDSVVAVEAGRPALAVENLVANVVLNQVLQFLLARQPSPRPRKSVAEVGDPGGGNHEFLGRLRVLLADEAVEPEQHGAKGEKLK